MSDHVVAYSQVHLAPSGVSPVFDPREPMGLASVTDAGRGLIVHTGVNMGWVRVRLLVGDDPLPREGWEEEAVVTMNVTEMLYLTSPTVAEDNFHPVYQPTKPGVHTLSVLARGVSWTPAASRPRAARPARTTSCTSLLTWVTPYPRPRWRHRFVNSLSSPHMESALVLRTCFSDQAAWEAIAAAVTAVGTGDEEGWAADAVPLDDPAYDGVTEAAILDLTSNDGYLNRIIVIVDSVAVITHDHPVLVLAVMGEKRGRSFRCLPDQIQSVENNLTLYNMDWADFIRSLDPNGVFRGF